jgi:holin-like protein
MRKEQLEKMPDYYYSVTMRIIKQLGLIFAFTFAGEILAHFIPFGFPASVTGMLLMLAALGLKILKPEQLEETTDYLSGNMAFFFLPAAATVLQNFALLKPVLWQLVFISVACTVFTFFATYMAVRALRLLLAKRR